MTTFYLLRHAQKEEVIGNPPLSPAGVKQAEYTAKYLKDKKIHAIFSSPLNRTAETAEIIAKQLRLSINFDQRLRERMNWGDEPNEVFEEFMSEWSKTDMDRDYEPRHGYSSREAGKRLEAVLHEVREKIHENAVLIVTHGGIVGDLLRNIFSDQELPLIVNKTSKVKYIHILASSITIIKWAKDRYLLEKIASVDHLPTRIL